MSREPFIEPKIEKGIPIPEPRKKKKPRVYQPTPWIAFLKTLEPGDSFRVTYWEANSAVQHMRKLCIKYARQAVPGWKLECRVWRVE